MPDTGKADVYLTGAIAILAEYPQAVMDGVSNPKTGTHFLRDRPSLSDIRHACDGLHAPIERELERQRAREEHLRGLPPPRRERTPEDQARIDEQVTRGCAQIAGAALRSHAPSGRLVSVPPREPMRESRRQSLLADLAERKRRNEERAVSG